MENKIYCDRELTPEQQLVADVIKISLEDLYGNDEKNRYEAQLFFKSKLFKATGLDFESLRKEYERINHIKSR